MTSEVKRIVVVGGGTAGWLAANHLAKKLKPAETPLEVVLVESASIPNIGVGEGTVPAIRSTLKYLGISETEFIRRCDVSFKQSVKFVDWNWQPGQTEGNYYHHLFDFPSIQLNDPTESWLRAAMPGAYADYTSFQGRLIDAGLAPKSIKHAEYEGLSSYAYHLDANKFSELLAEHAVDKLGVKRQFADVTGVVLADDGSIECLKTDDGEDILGDLFVDCTGFSSLLLGKYLDVPFRDLSHILLVDKALAVQCPYSVQDGDIPGFTRATAKASGWVWDIGLRSRRGVGYVYSSRHEAKTQAEDNFRSYLQRDDLEFREIDMRVGRREKFWHKNCVAIGLSQGFVEPLEATGLLMFDATAKMLADLFPYVREQLPLAEKQFNEKVDYAWDRVVDFIKLHYCISQRDDSEFWRDNKSSESIPDSLKELLDNWRWRVPNHYDFSSTLSVFNLENYLYVLYGMNYATQLGSPSLIDEGEQLAEKLSMIEKYRLMAFKQLKPHRQALDAICEHGLKPI